VNLYTLNQLTHLLNQKHPLQHPKTCVFKLSITNRTLLAQDKTQPTTTQFDAPNQLVRRGKASIANPHAAPQTQKHYTPSEYIGGLRSKVGRAS